MLSLLQNILKAVQNFVYVSFIHQIIFSDLTAKVSYIQLCFVFKPNVNSILNLHLVEAK